MNNEAQDPQIGSTRAWLIWGLSAVAFGYAFFQRVAPSVMVSDLMADFAIGAGVLGTLSALYFYPYVLLQVPLGAILDRLGARKLLALALTIAGAGSIVFAIADSIALAYAGRILIGIGSAVGFLSSLALASKWFPPHRFAFFAGLVMFFGMTSGMLAQGPLAKLVDAFGWRNVMWSLGGFSVLLAIVIYAFVRNAPDGVSRTDKVVESWGQVWSGLIKALSGLEVWKTAIVASTMSGPMLTIGALWGTPYLMTAYGLEKSHAASLVSLLFLGWAFSAPASGWFSDRIRKRKAILVIGSTVTSIALGIICFVDGLPLWITVALFVIVGVFGANMAVCFALVRENASQEISGSVSGIVNSLTVASGAILQPLVGFALDKLWNGQTIDGARAYLATDFQSSFILVLISSVGGLLVCLTLKESIAFGAPKT